MAYTPTVWATGDVITAEKLNKAEQGIADANGIVCTITYDSVSENYTADKAFSEICDALDMGKPVRFIFNNSGIFKDLYVFNYAPEIVAPPPIGTLPANLTLYSLPTIASDGVYVTSIVWTLEAGEADSFTVTSLQYPREA